MKIVERIKSGKLKGWTIRKSKHGWYDLYSSNGVSQTQGKHTLDEIIEIVESKQSN
jgi:PII-like signaling protein